jgi:2-iminobutanoate/2-iminopropanoate deaminase
MRGAAKRGPIVAPVALIALTGLAAAQSPERVKTLAPPGAIKTTGTWSLGARAGDFVYVAGMRGIDRRATRSSRARRPAFAKAFSTCA